jgi:hypothetical protein
MNKLVFKEYYHKNQYTVFKDPVRFKVIDAGRRWGKTRGCITWITLKLLENQNSMGWWVAPVYPQAKIAYRYFLKLYSHFIVKKNESELMITLVGGSILFFKSADKPDNLRGEGINFLVLDECGVMKEDTWTEVLRPALMDTKGEACFIGTPKGMNWFHALFMEGQDALKKYIKSWQYSSYDNPTIDPNEIKLLENELPEQVVQQEIYAEFIEDIGGIFRGVKACAIGNFEEPQHKREYYMGVDLARKNDFTVISVVRADTGSLVAWDRFNKINWSLQEERILKYAEKYKPHIKIDEGQVGDKVLEDLQMKYADIEGVMFTNANKTAMINHLSNLIEKKIISYPDIPELVNELQIYQYEVLPSGNLRMNAPLGYHDDCVISLGLACWDLVESKRVVEFDAIGSSEFAKEIEDDFNTDDTAGDRQLNKKFW